MISIGMPVYNCRATLPAAMVSIQEQTFPDWELLLIDDGSTDGTAELARQFDDDRIRLVADGQRLGLPARLNQAIDLSQGPYFARMDGDDICYPERLERQVTFVEAQPEVDLVGSAMLVFRAEGEILGKRAGPETHAAICHRSTRRFRMFHPTFMGRLAWFKSYYYDARAVLCEDQDLLLRSNGRSCFANLPEILLGYREQKLVLGKILRSRRFFAQAVMRQLKREGRLIVGPGALVEEGLKAALDILAIGTGMNYHLLRQRAQRSSLSTDEVARWEQVWSLVNRIGADQARGDDA